jgi:hypothetical protein
VDSFGQKSYYGYRAPVKQYDEEKQKLKAIVLTLSQNDRTIQVNLIGELVSFRASLGDEIKKDYQNKIERIGDIEIEYDYEKKVKRFGQSEIKYYMGKMTEIGNYEIIYDYSGEFQGTKEKIKSRLLW